MSRQLALLALVVFDLGCNGRVRIFDWGIDEDDFPADSGETASTTTASEGTTEGSAASTDDTTGGSTETTAETSTPSTETGTHTETTVDTTDSSSSTTGPPCGNGMCAPDENNNNCPQDCSPACGNMVEEMGEDCDDGNDDNTDACIECKDAVCSDGFVHTGAEECDDGDQDDSDECRNNCTIPRRVVFVTKDVFQGNMRKMGVNMGSKGISGADAQCAAAATVAGLSGPFKAWLSDLTNDPTTRFSAKTSNFAGIYTLIDGTKVADGWSDLIDGTLDHAIDMTEDMTGMQNAVPWSNTEADGTRLSDTNHCDNWGSNDAGKSGRVGYAKDTVTNTQWTDNGPQFCSSYSPLYCFEDP